MDLFQLSLDNLFFHYNDMVVNETKVKESQLHQIYNTFKMKLSKHNEELFMNERKIKNPYQNFFKEMQVKIKTEHPKLSFREISKMISEKWNSLSIQEKEIYKEKRETNENIDINIFEKTDTTISQEDDIHEEESNLDEEEIFHPLEFMGDVDYNSEGIDEEEEDEEGDITDDDSIEFKFEE